MAVNLRGRGRGGSVHLDNTSPFAAEFTMCLDDKGHEVVVIAVKGTYDFPVDPGTAAPLADQQVKVLLADVFGPDPAHDAPIAENDLAPFKPRCDVLVYGAAIAPHGQPTTHLDVGLRIGGWHKAFTVHGNRIWLKSTLGYRVSDPRPFIRQNISYDVAWGGVDPIPNDPVNAATCEENPSGNGYYPNLTERDGAPLPVTAERGNIITDTLGPHQPMAFGPLGRTWLPRRTHVGTYDDAWLENRMPLMPHDFRPQYFQAAPPDQLIAYPRGGELVELINLSPTGRVQMTLPNDRVIVNFARKNGPVTQKTANLDTVLFLPEAGKFCLTWRTRFVTDRDIHDLQSMTIRRETERATI